MPGSSGAGDLVRKTAHLVLGIASLSGHVLSLSPALLSLVVLVTMLVVVLILFVGASSDPGPDGGADACPDAATDPMRSRSSAAAAAAADPNRSDPLHHTCTERCISARSTLSGIGFKIERYMSIIFLKNVS